MLYTPGGSGVATEAEQVMLGIKLDLAYSKAQILRMYADVAYFGHGYYGLAAASCGYFGTSPPGSPCPRRPPWPAWSRARPPTTRSRTTPGRRAREAHVLGRLVATGKITAAQAAAAPTPSICLWWAAAGRPARANRANFNERCAAAPGVGHVPGLTVRQRSLPGRAAFPWPSPAGPGLPVTGGGQPPGRSAGRTSRLAGAAAARHTHFRYDQNRNSVPSAMPVRFSATLYQSLSLSG